MVVSLIGNCAAPAAALVSAPILAHSLGVAGRGDVAGATSPAILLIGIATLGIPESLTYHIARSRSTLRSGLRVGLLATLGSGILAAGAIILVVLVAVPPSSTLRHLLIVIAPSVVPGLLVGVLRASAAGCQDWAQVNTERIVGAVSRLAIIAGLSIAGLLNPLTASLAIAYGSSIGGVIYILRPRTGGQLAESQPLKARDVLRFGMRVWLGAIAGVLLARLDQVLMVPLSSSTQLGLYAVAVNVADVPLLVSSAARDVLLASESEDRSDSRVASIARVTTSATAVVAVAIAGTSIWWIALAFGEEFTGALPALLILALGSIFGAPGSVAGSALTARGAPQLRSYSLLASVVLNLALLAILVPHFGATGAAVSTAASLLLFSTVNAYFLRSRYNFTGRLIGLGRADLNLVRRALSL